MAILFISHKYPPATGGMEKFSYELIKYFETTDHTIYKIVYDGRSNKFLWYLTLKSRIRKFLKENNDVEVIHLNDGLMAALCTWIKSEFNIKVVITLHGLDLVFPLPYFQKKIIPKFNAFDTIICVSNATRNEAINRKIDHKKVVFVANGVDHETKPVNDIEVISIKNQLSIPLTKTMLVGLGRPVKRKGYSWFVKEVLPKLDDTFVFVLCGPRGKYNDRFWKKLLPTKLLSYIELMFGLGSDEMNLRELEEKYPEKFIRTGYLRYNAITQLLQSSGIFIMPNVKIENDMEGFGLVALEASLNNCIVLASGIEGITDAIVHKKNGYLLETKNDSMWLEKINEITSNQDLGKIKSEFKTYTIGHYSWNKMGREYEEIFFN